MTKRTTHRSTFGTKPYAVRKRTRTRREAQQQG